MKKPIVTVPHQTLRKKSSSVEYDERTLTLIQNLVDTLLAKKNPQGVGLSAPQIGKNHSIFITWLAADESHDPGPEDIMIFCNPEIQKTGAERTFGPDPDDPILEGCLSIPGIYGPVPRYESVELAYDTILLMDHQQAGGFVRKEARFDGFLARVIQHELDHLKGILFTDYTQEFSLPLYEYTGKSMRPIDRSVIAAF